eukprot:TRINITY_DN109561_c0_g1_i1.p1 TRINITY_DN109561_c0_g1~~TRINITY_DN109561_c0_g1_i1.p1  ORF type:complete len:670 (+),score=108.39 TRINITY_DN109561_c0_g1_i1:210-2219(+)
MTQITADLVIQGATILDGTGAPAFVADIAIAGELIVAVGQDLKVAGNPQLINAAGLLVAPGWIDVHTHFDAQATWDPLLSPSTSAGVTTAIMGNCGVGFAPCQKELRPFLLDLMEAVEDIPGTALHEGIQWEWETFPEYLDALARRSYACDLAVMIGHGGVRTWVMGKRASLADMPGGADKNPVTSEEIAAIGTVVREAVAAGAFGFSTSRLLLHRDKHGILTPGALASKEEVLCICDAVVAGGGGIFEFSTDFASYDDLPYIKHDPKKRQDYFNSELEWLAAAMAKHPDKLRISFGASADGAEFWSRWTSKRQQVPGQCLVQVQIRPQSFHMSLASGITMFTPSPEFRRAQQEAGGHTGRLVELLKEPGRRSAILQDAQKFTLHGQQTHQIQALAVNEKGVRLPAWFYTGHDVYPWTPSYEPTADMAVTSIAARSGKHVLEVCYDLLLETGGPHAGVLWHPLFGYSGHNDNIASMFHRQNIIPGFGDAGAHNTILTDAVAATSSLCHYGRDRARGLAPLEKIVKTQTSDAATLFGLLDRGVVRPGKRADLNIIDFDRLNVKAPYWCNDLPTNAGRWMQNVEGYHTTIVRGVITFQNGKHSGELPGKLVRNPRAVGLSANSVSVTAAGVDESVTMEDLTEYAVELSRDGGASAQARVLRHEQLSQRSRL